MSLNCKFHPDRPATKRCEKCGIMLCPVCSVTYTSGLKNDPNRISKFLCSFCNNELVQQESIWTRLPIMGSVLYLFAYFFSSAAYSSEIVKYLVIGGISLVATFIFIVDLFQIKKILQKKTHASLSAIKFYQTIHNSESNTIRSDASCYFHPNQTASNKCTRCGEVICRECERDIEIFGQKMIYSINSENRKLCPICVFHELQKSLNFSRILVIVLWSAFTIICGLLLGFGELEYSALFFLFALFSITRLYFRFRKDLQKKKKETMFFIEQNHLPSTYIEAYPSIRSDPSFHISDKVLIKSTSEGLICAKCGNSIDTKQDFCPNCHLSLLPFKEMPL